ncbi:hypothetical protein VVR12_07950 [Rothia sp. LK2588]|uniref:hypothetical protein n=1 Tax=Rothia sp. LK2588 TaxID=3114369 RepID=UPI0034CE6255
MDLYIELLKLGAHGLNGLRQVQADLGDLVQALAKRDQFGFDLGDKFFDGFLGVVAHRYLWRLCVL